jgi:hypothetical protein
MFETRDHRPFLFVSLFLSVIVHLIFLLLVRVEIGLEDRDLRSSIIDIRKIFRVVPSGRTPGYREKTIVVKIREKGRELEELAPEIEEEEEEEKRVVELEVPESVPGPQRLFDPDSLDLLLTYPWIVPLPDDRPGPRRITGLERALRRLMSEEIERREAEGLTLDSKYGEFGVSSRGILLGPIVIPLPLAPYTSGEKRAEERAHSEIEAQSLQESMRDDDLQEQRERIIEWKKRRGGGE